MRSSVRGERVTQGEIYDIDKKINRLNIRYFLFIMRYIHTLEYKESAQNIYTISRQILIDGCNQCEYYYYTISMIFFPRRKWYFSLLSMRFFPNGNEIFPRYFSPFSKDQRIVDWDSPIWLSKYVLTHNFPLSLQNKDYSCAFLLIINWIENNPLFPYFVMIFWYLFHNAVPHHFKCQYLTF